MTERDAVYFEDGFPESDVIRITNFLWLDRKNATTRNSCDYAWHMSRKRWYLYFVEPVSSGARKELLSLVDGLVESNSRKEITRIVSPDVEKTTTYGGGMKFFITNTIK